MLKKNDIIPLVSFPKSGNTWMRFILANIFKADRSQEIDFGNISDYTYTSFEEVDCINNHNLINGSPLFIKQHCTFEDIGSKNFDKAIYIYRNGFDTLLSYWHFTNAQSPGLFKNFERIFISLLVYVWTLGGSFIIMD